MSRLRLGNQWHLEQHWTSQQIWWKPCTQNIHGGLICLNQFTQSVNQQLKLILKSRRTTSSSSPDCAIKGKSYQLNLLILFKKKFHMKLCVLVKSGGHKHSKQSNIQVWLRPLSSQDVAYYNTPREAALENKRPCVQHTEEIKLGSGNWCSEEKERGVFVNQSHAQSLNARLCFLSVISFDQSERERKNKNHGGLHFNLGRPPVIPRGGSMSVQCKMLSSPNSSALTHVSLQTSCDNRSHMCHCYLWEIPGFNKCQYARG